MQGLFGDKGRSIRQVTPKTIMNTRVTMILETLSVSFEMAKGILKEHKGVHMGVNSSLGFSTKKNNTPNNESSRKGIRE